MTPDIAVGIITNTAGPISVVGLDKWTRFSVILASMLRCEANHVHWIACLKPEYHDSYMNAALYATCAPKPFEFGTDGYKP